MKESNSLVESVVLKDILAQPTEVKSIQPIEIAQDILNNSDFAPEPFGGGFHEPDPEHSPSPEPGPAFEPEEPYDAEVEATKLVNLLNAGNTLLVSPIANFRMIKKRGGREALDKMKAAYQKQKDGKKLSEEEDRMLSAFNSFKTDMALLNGEIPFSEKQLEILKTAAVPYCQESKMKINGAFAFWGIFGGMQTEKIIKILTA